MADVKKMRMTSLVLTSKGGAHGKKFRIGPRGFCCFFHTKQFSGGTAEMHYLQNSRQFSIHLMLQVKISKFPRNKETVVVCVKTTAELLDLPSEEIQWVNKLPQLL